MPDGRQRANFRSTMGHDQAIEMMYRLLRAAQLYVEGLSGTRYVKTTVNGYGFFLRGRAEQNIPW